MLLSVSPSLGLPATVACLRVFVRKDTPWDAKVPADDPSMQLQRLYISMLQGNCLFGSLKSRKLVEGLFVRVCAPSQECRGTCPRRSATTHAQWPASDWYINTRRRTHAHSLKEHRRELSVCITVLAADKGEPQALDMAVVLCYTTHINKHGLLPIKQRLQWHCPGCCYTAYLASNCSTISENFQQSSGSKTKCMPTRIKVPSYMSVQACDSSHQPHRLQYLPSVNTALDLHTVNILNT